MQVPLTGHLREPAHVDERSTGIGDGRFFTCSSPPLRVVEPLAAAVTGAVTLGPLVRGVIADDGHSEPKTSVSACKQM